MCMLHTHTHKSVFKVHSVHHRLSFPFCLALPETWATSFFSPPHPSALIPYLLSAAATELVFILTHTHNVRLQSGHIHMLDLITSVPQISDMQFMHHMMAFWDNSVN